MTASKAMAAAAREGRRVRFADFELDFDAGELRRSGTRVALAEQPLRLLEELVAQAGVIVSRDQLRDRLWGDRTFVDFEHGLNAAVKRLRDALGDAADEPRFIETVPKRGYRFIASIEPAPLVAGAAPAPAAPPAGSPRARWRLAGAIALLGVAAIGWRLVRPPSITSSATAPAPVRSLAVLPFDDLSPDVRDTHYADGLTEALITELSALTGLDKVIGRQTVQRYRASPTPLSKVASELQVDALVTASLLRSAGRLRVTARLVSGATERHLWAATYERADGEVLLIQREIVDAIAENIRLALGPEARARMPLARPVSAAAFDAYVAGRQAMNSGPADTLKAVELLEKATALDPGFAPGHGALAESLARGAMHGGVPDAERRGMAAAERAIELDPNVAEAHSALGALLLISNWDWSGADNAHRRALALNPNSAIVHLARVQYLVQAARYDEAIEEGRRSIELDPSSYRASGRLAWALLHARRFDESIRLWDRALEVNPDPVAQSLAVLALAGAGRSGDVQQRCSPDTQGVVAIRCAQAQALLGNPAPARRLIGEDPERVGLFFLVELHGALGDAPGVLRLLEQARAARDQVVLYLNGPVFDPIRAYPGFREFQRQMHYPAFAWSDERVHPARP